MCIANAVVVKPSGSYAATVLADDRKIQAILPPGDRPQASTTVDGQGRYLLPGVIDPHVHLGVTRPFADACRTESEAAVTGGVTFAIHYLLSATSFFDVYGEHERAVRAGSLIDVAFHGMIQNDTQVAEIPRTVAELGITSYKFHMAMKGPEAGYGIKGVDDGLMFDGLQQVAKCPGVMAIAHTENIDVILRSRDRMMAQYPAATDIATWEQYRPAFTEEEAIVRAARLATAANAPFTVAHNSVGTGPGLLAEAKVHNPNLYMETCPQFLLLNTGMDLGTAGKMNPPLRSAAHSAALWKALENHQIDWLGSDHCDYDTRDKEGSIWDAAPGLTSGLQVILPCLLSEGVHKGRLSIERVVELTSANVARILGFDSKGTIEIGNDADFVLVDMDREVTLTTDVLNGYSDFTPYEGMTLKGWPRLTVAGGQIRYDRGDLNTAGPHRGRVVTQARRRVPASSA